VLGEMDERHAVGQLEGGVVRAVGLRGSELLVHGADELLDLGDAVGVYPVPNHHIRHFDLPGNRSVLALPE
jgi:hypothetical protein